MLTVFVYCNKAMSACATAFAREVISAFMQMEIDGLRIDPRSVMVVCPEWRSSPEMEVRSEITVIVEGIRRDQLPPTRAKPNNEALREIASSLANAIHVVTYKTSEPQTIINVIIRPALTPDQGTWHVFTPAPVAGN